MCKCSTEFQSLQWIISNWSRVQANERRADGEWMLYRAAAVSPTLHHRCAHWRRPRLSPSAVSPESSSVFSSHAVGSNASLFPVRIFRFDSWSHENKKLCTNKPLHIFVENYDKSIFCIHFSSSSRINWFECVELWVHGIRAQFERRTQNQEIRKSVLSVKWIRVDGVRFIDANSSKCV